LFFFILKSRGGVVVESSMAGWMVDLFDQIDLLINKLNSQLNRYNRIFKTLIIAGDLPTDYLLFSVCSAQELNFHKVCFFTELFLIAIY